MKLCLLLLLIIGLMLCVGCEESVTSPPDKSIESLFPIQDGSWWAVRTPFHIEIDTLRYIPSDLPGADNETNWFTVTWNSNEGINNMLAKPTLEGVTYAWDTTKEKPYSLLGMKTEIKTLLPKNTKGSNSDFSTYLVAKFPIQHNEDWIMMTEETTDNSNELATINDIMQCINLNQAVETPAGTFECIVFKETYEFIGDFNEGQSSDFVRYYYYSEGVGLIKVLFVDSIENEVLVEYELVDYHLED